MQNILKIFKKLSIIRRMMMNHQNKIIILICEFQRCDKFQLFPTTYKLFLSIHWFRFGHWWLPRVILQVYDDSSSRLNFLFLPFEWWYSRMPIITLHRNNDALDFRRVFDGAEKIVPVSTCAGIIARGKYPTEKRYQLSEWSKRSESRISFFS